MKEVLIALNQKPIAVYPIYIQITGSLPAGVLLSQLMYWFSAVGGRDFYKPDAEILAETHLTPAELKSAKARLKSLPFIRIYLKGVPAKTHYAIDADILSAEIAQFTSSCLVKSAKLDWRNSPNSVGEIHQPITENTTEKHYKETEPVFEKTEPVKDKTSKDWTTTARHVEEYLHDHPDQLLAMEERSGFKGDLKSIVQTWARRKAGRSEWFILTIPEGDRHFTWIAQVLAQVETFMRNSKKFDAQPAAAATSRGSWRRPAEPIPPLGYTAPVRNVPRLQDLPD